MSLPTANHNETHIPDDRNAADMAVPPPMSEAETLLRMALVSPPQARELFPDFRLARLVAARFDMDDTDVGAFANIIDCELLDPCRTIQRPFDYHLRRVIRNHQLDTFFNDDGPGLHHHAVRPTGYDFDHGEVIAAAMEQWRADYRAMSAERQMLTASILWLYRAGPDNRWLRRVPCTWHAADAIDCMRRTGTLADWGRLITLYPGW